MTDEERQAAQRRFESGYPPLPETVLREALENTFDYLGPDPNDAESGEKWGADPRALAALDALIAERDEWKREADLSKWPKEAAQEFYRFRAAIQAIRQVMPRTWDGPEPPADPYEYAYRTCVAIAGEAIKGEVDSYGLWSGGGDV